MYLGGEVRGTIHHDLTETALKIKNIDEYISSVLISTGTSLNELQDLSKSIQSYNSDDKNNVLKNANFVLREKASQFKNFKRLFTDLWNYGNEGNFRWEYCTYEIYKLHLSQYILIEGKTKGECLKIELEKLKSKFLNKEDSADAKQIDGFKFYFSKSPNDFIILNFLNRELTESIKREEQKKIHHIESLLSLETTYNVDSNQINLELNVPSLKFYKDYPISIFNNLTSFQLFEYLDENYDIKFKPTKYINLYHYFSSLDNLLICTQLDYREFISKHKGIIISKITPMTFKYEDKTLPILKNLNILFDKN